MEKLVHQNGGFLFLERASYSDTTVVWSVKCLPCSSTVKGLTLQ